MDKYDRAAEALLPLLGGPGNITTVAHCVTRLRLELANRAAVDDDRLRAHPAVLGVRETTGFHLIVGPAVVAELAAAMRQLVDTSHDGT